MMWRGVCADPKVLHEHVASFPHPKSIGVVWAGDRIDVGHHGMRTPQTSESNRLWKVWRGS